MEIAIMASFLAERDMDIYTSQGFVFLKVKVERSLVTWCIFFLIGLGALPMQGQKEIHKIHLIQTCDSPYRIEKVLIEHDNARPVMSYVSAVIDPLIADDYLEASMDSIVLRSEQNSATAYVHVGPRYDFHNIQLDSLGEDLLDRLDIKSPRNAQEYLASRDKVRDHYAEFGYPFAVVSLEDMKLEDGVVHGQLNVDERNKIIMDSIIVHGNLSIRQGYLRNLLNIHKGDLYKHTDVSSVNRKLDQLRFLELTEPPALSFIYDYASLNLYTKKKNASRFDLIFGVIPTTNLQESQLFLSLDFTAEMMNKLGYGEYIFVDFERLRPEQQKFETKFNYPYFLDTKFAIDTRFKLFRLATDYQTLTADLGVQYLLNDRDRIRVAWNYESSRIVEIDTMRLLNTRRLPDDLSVSQTGFVVEANFSRLDHFFNPRRGTSLNVSGTAGQKKILIDPLITNINDENVDFETAYDTLDLSSVRYELKLDAQHFVPIARRGAFTARVNVGWRYSPVGLFRNEKFQIGGNQLLRGFDEASIFTSYYAISTLSYRLLLSENSYFSAPFIDIGFIETLDANNIAQTSLAMGIGAGLVMETKVGMFNFSLAVGRTAGQDFNFGRPKAHFGYISLF